VFLVASGAVDDGAGAHERREGVVALGIAALALLPFVVAIVTFAGNDYVPVGDIALTDLRVRDVFGSDIPLVGAYSRFGWNHPGPLPFWLLAPISAVFGAEGWATVVANAVVQAGAVGAIAWGAWRAGRLPVLLAALAFTALAYGAMGSGIVIEAWNPNLAYPFFILFVLLAWTVARTDRIMLAPLAVAGGIVVQAHVGYLPLVGVVAVAALAMGLRADRDNLAAWRRPALVALVVGAVLWIPPVVHEFVHPSNIRPLTESLLTPDESTLGPGTAARILAEEFRVPPPWFGGDHDLDPFASLVTGASSWWLVLPAGLLGAGWFATTRRRVDGSRELLVLASALLATGLVAISRVLGEAEEYVFYWRVPVALLVVFASGWSVWVALRLDASKLARGVAFAGLAAIVGWASIATSIRIGQADDVNTGQALSIEALQSVGEPEDAVLVRAAGIAFLGLHRAVVNELDRDGADVRVDKALDYQFGSSRGATPAEVDEIWYVAEAGQFLSLLTAAPGARELWVSTPLTDAEEEELRAGQRELWAAVDAAGRPDLLTNLASPLVAFALADIPGADPATVARVAELNQGAEQGGPCRCGIVAFAADEVPTNLPF